MDKFSKNNTYYKSDGTSVSSAQVERRIRVAKQAKLDRHDRIFGYVFCEDCKRNENCGEPIDLSHNISVKKAKEMRKVELAWSVDNIKLRCRICHRKHDNL